VTITQDRVQQDVSLLVKEVRELDALRKSDRNVTPKPGILVQKSKWAPDWIGEKVVIEGEFFPPLPRPLLPGRTIFSPEPLFVEGVARYLELKGYGREGRDLFLHEHNIGSVYWGMYLDEAQNEFDRLLAALEAKLPVSLPLAVVEIPREEYIRMALPGFAQTLVVRIHFARDGVPDWLLDVIGKDLLNSMFFLQDAEQKAIQQVVNWVQEHPKGIEQGIRALVAIHNPEHPDDTFEDVVARSADAVLSNRRFGYLIRAPKSPIRVGDPSNPYVLSEENKKLARSMGKTFRKLLEMGFLHHCPGTGNWTSAGELTDFADTFDIKTERAELEAHMRAVKHPDMLDFLRYLIGKPHTGKFCPFFIEGVCGRSGVSVDEAAQELLSLIP